MKAEISFHDPATGSTRRLYPPEPASIAREEYLKRIDDVFRTAEASGRLSEFILRCRGRESGEVLAIDRQSRSLAILVSLDETIGWERKLSDRFSAFSLLRRLLNNEEISETYRDKFDVFVSDIKRNHLIEEAVSGIEDEELRGLLDKLRARLADVKYGAPEELQSVDPAWLADRTWEKLKNALTFPPASTKVVYIYPELNTRMPLEWYELTPVELQDRFQISALKDVLDPVALQRVRSGRERSPAARPAK